MPLSITAHEPPGNGLRAQSGYTPRPGQDVHDAAYTMAYAYPGGVAALAARMGVSRNTLKHKLNPNNDTHHLTLREAVVMQQMAGSAAILNAMADELGYVCTLATPDATGGDPLMCLVALNSTMADLMRALGDPLDAGKGAAGSVSRNQFKRVEIMAQEVIAAVGHAVAMVRGLMRDAPTNE